MNKYAIAIIVTATAIFSTLSNAETLRCKAKLVKIGDTKADVISKCGDPIMSDSFCQPIAITTQPQGIQNGNNNVQNNTVISTCENIDIWTYNLGTGKFITHLYFSQGELQSIHYGDRVK